jgi:hypothetical protein
VVPVKTQVEMKIRRRLFRSVLCLAQAGFLISGNAAVFAAPSALDAKLDLLDKQVFGEEHKSMKQSAKLRALELNLFGNEHDGNLSSRVEEIAKALNYKGGDLLLPPMAPQLDTSGGHTLSTAPDAHAASPIYDSRATDTASGAAPPASKQVLRSAMQDRFCRWIARAQTLTTIWA